MEAACACPGQQGPWPPSSVSPGLSTMLGHLCPPQPHLPQTVRLGMPVGLLQRRTDSPAADSGPSSLPRPQGSALVLALGSHLLLCQAPASKLSSTHTHPAMLTSHSLTSSNPCWSLQSPPSASRGTFPGHQPGQQACLPPCRPQPWTTHGCSCPPAPPAAPPGSRGCPSPAAQPWAGRAAHLGVLQQVLQPRDGDGAVTGVLPVQRLLQLPQLLLGLPHI